MAFPTTPLGVVARLQLGGVWTDVSSDVLARDRIGITRGRADEAARVDAGKCNLTFNNSGGKYSPRNSTGPYYGLIGRNTPLQVSVRSVPHLAVRGAGAASTPDAAPLDIVGDLDVRIDLASDTVWTDYTGFTDIISKYDNVGVNQRSWRVYLWSGRPVFNWSTDGTGPNTLTAICTNLVPVVEGRQALRVTLDVDNGTGGNTVRWYTAPTLAGPWVQLGADIVQAGVTSIFNSTTALIIGATAVAGQIKPSMDVYGAEVRSGIGGTAVANPDFTALAPGVTSFADAAGRTWTVAGGEVTDLFPRFAGEVSSWPPKWDLSGKDVWTPVEAAGILRRLGQGKTPLRSPMFREFASPARTHIVAYWPCEDGSLATSLASADSGAAPLTITGAVTPAAYTGWAASDAMPKFGTGMAAGPLPFYAATGQTALRFFLTLPAGGLASEQRLITINGTGGRWTVSADASGSLRLRGWDTSGASLLDSGLLTWALNGKPTGIVVNLTERAGTVDWGMISYQFDTTSMFAPIPQQGTTSTIAGAGTVGRITTVALGEDRALGETSIGHVAIADDLTAYANTSSAYVAWAGEPAGSRIARLCTENNIPCLVYGFPADSAALGAQPRATLLDVLEAAADADGGILHERPDVIGLAYRPRTTLYNQPVAIPLDYAANAEVAGLDPTDDDQHVRNDITVKRQDGSSYRATQDSGPLNLQDPPVGVGRYDDAPTLSLGSDAQCLDQAGWRLHLGTWDEARYPHLTVDLAAAPQLIDEVLAVRIGDRATVAHPPAWLPPDRIDQMVQGWTETLDLFAWTVVYNCTPYGPWRVAVLDDPVLGRADTDGSTLASAVTSGGTVLTVQTTNPDSPRWTLDPAQCPLDVRLGGEVCTVTAVTDGIADTFGRTVSSGWGSADTGQAWTTSGGSASDFSVASGTGRHSNGTVAVPRYTVTASPAADFDVQASISSSVLALGASIVAGLAARFGGSGSDFYQARLEFTTARAVVLTIRKTISSADSQLAVFTPPDLLHTAGTRYAVRFQGSGTTLRAKVWPAGSPEPQVWHLTVTDGSRTAAGSLACRSVLATGNTNTLPVVVDFDDYRLTNPQRLTATRSVNGVVKAQAAGTDVRLDTPMVLAL